MTLLRRSQVRPLPEDDLSPAEQKFVRQWFDTYAGEVLVDTLALQWTEIDAVEIALAPRAAGVAGWFVRHVVHGDQRYHIGLYVGRAEAVIPNAPLGVARYVLACLAYYAPRSIRYAGPSDLLS